MWRTLLKVVVFYKRGCRFSEQAIDDLRNANLGDDDVGVIIPGDSEEMMQWWREMGSPTFPQILVDGKLVPGGADGLRRLLATLL